MGRGRLSGHALRMGCEEREDEMVAQVGGVPFAASTCPAR